ncbi:Nn.00g096600.m01.CDS01 [Neocucurbitaria sp. VM-36]
MPPTAVQELERQSKTPDLLPHRSQTNSNELLIKFLEENPNIKYIYVQWLDLMAMLRCRIVPVKEVSRIVKGGERIGIPQGSTGTLQNDTMTPAVNRTGQVYVEPDMQSLRRTHKKDPLGLAATVLSYWRNEEGFPIPACPRNSLESLLDDLRLKHSTTLLVGFEIEVSFLKRDESDSGPDQAYIPLTKTHAWGTLHDEQWLCLPVFAEIIDALDQIGISIQQFHSEAAAGQYEFILPPLSPLAAVDALIQTRQVITQIAALHNVRATLHPQPFPGTTTAAHAHISLHPPAADKAFFVGGVLQHLRALCAITMPESVSYTRVTDSHWANGSWVAWGTQNRETPLRRVSAGHWEVRSVDGMANPYLALAAILAAGLLGLKRGVGGEEGVEHKDVAVDPAVMDEQARVRSGIVERLPGSIDEALSALAADEELCEELPRGLVKHYLVMKEAEQKMLQDMSEVERRVWLIERY